MRTTIVTAPSVSGGGSNGNDACLEARLDSSSYLIETSGTTWQIGSQISSQEKTDSINNENKDQVSQTEIGEMEVASYHNLMQIRHFYQFAVPTKHMILIWWIIEYNSQTKPTPISMQT